MASKQAIQSESQLFKLCQNDILHLLHSGVFLIEVFISEKKDWRETEVFLVIVFHHSILFCSLKSRICQQLCAQIFSIFPFFVLEQ